MANPFTGPALELLVSKLKVEDYADRTGYDEKFLGAKFTVPLPSMLKAAKAQVAEVVNARRPGVLDYTHYSVVLNKARKFCFYAVVNIDGSSTQSYPRINTWFIDPRVDDDLQAGPIVYDHNPLDRGHMVRRLDPVWNGDGSETKISNRDTFHFTNACPQVHSFNDGIWGVLEDYLLKNADAKNLRLTVYTGPVLREDDKKFNGIRLPREFWKVAVMVSTSGPKPKLSAAGFMLSQEHLLGPFGFDLGAIPNKVRQVPIKDIEKLTALRFGKATEADALTSVAGPMGAGSKARVLESVDEIVINRRK